MIRKQQQGKSQEKQRVMGKDVPWQNRFVKNRRQTWNRTQSCPVPFLQIFGSRSCWTRTRPYKKTAQNGKGRPWQARMDRSNLPKYSNSTSFSVATSFFHVFTPFSSVFGLFTIVQGSVKIRLKVCLTSFKVLSMPFKAVFVLLLSKFAYW